MTEPNPLLEPWTTPFGIPPFDRIRPEHFTPAFAEAMASHLAETDAIGAEPAPPTFANTIEALQRSGQTLSRVGAVFANLVVSQGGAALEVVDREMAPRLAQHGMRVSLDPAVFARVDALHRQRATLDLAEDQARLLERTHLGFVRSGAALDAVAKARMSAISERLAVLHTAFGQNVVHDETMWHLPLTEADLDGLPAFVRTGAAQAAVDRGVTGYAVTLSRSLIEPFLTFSSRRDLRQVAYEAWVARGTPGGARQPGADPRDPGAAPRAGQAAGLRQLRRVPPGRHDGRQARGGRGIAGGGVGAGQAQGGGRARPAAGRGARRGLQRRPGTGATTPSACAVPTTPWMRRR